MLVTTIIDNLQLQAELEVSHNVGGTLTFSEFIRAELIPEELTLEVLTTGGTITSVRVEEVQCDVSNEETTLTVNALTFHDPLVLGELPVRSQRPRYFPNPVESKTQH